MMKRLILGGTRSGKSDHAQGLLMRADTPRRAVVLGRPLDLSFRARILDHRAVRSPEVEVVEISLDLPEALAALGDGSVLVDSLDFWLFSWLGAGRKAQDAAQRLAEAIGACAASELIMVSSEIGLGPLAADSATRAFADALGALNKAAADACDQVSLVVAGRALALA
jgi:adenosylcobinamide kinase/adenosylcobinamide-phosphate guanylyltransferase